MKCMEMDCEKKAKFQVLLDFGGLLSLDIVLCNECKNVMIKALDREEIGYSAYQITKKRSKK